MVSAPVRARCFEPFQRLEQYELPLPFCAAVNTVRLRQCQTEVRRFHCLRNRAAARHGSADVRARDRRREPGNHIRMRLGRGGLASEACVGADPSYSHSVLGVLRVRHWPTPSKQHVRGSRRVAHEYVREPLGRRRSLPWSPSRAAPGFHSYTTLARTCGVTAPARGRQRVRSQSKSNAKLRACVFCDLGLRLLGVL